jgi:PAS domain S-box-containing protein
MEAVARTNLAEAIALVFGDEYRQAKDAIMQPISESRDQLRARLSTAAHELATRATVAGFTAIGALTVNAAAVVGALLLFYRKRVVNPLAALNQDLLDLVARKAGGRVSSQDEASEIGELARSIENYRVAVEEAERQRWVKTSVADVADNLQGAEQPDEFGKRLLSRLVPLVGGGYGAFHLWDEGAGHYCFTSGYGCEGHDADKGFAPEEGIVGQAAAERTVIVLSDLPDGYVRIASGLGGAQPRVLAAIPVLAQDRVLAVVEVASFAALTGQQRELLSEMAAMVALKLEVLQRNLRTRELLEQVRTSEEHNRLILESSAEGIFGTDTEGRITFVNPAAHRMLGFMAEELIGQTSHATFHQRRPDGSEYPEEECPMFAAYTNGKASRIDDEFLWRKDGTGFPVEYGATPMLKDGVLLGAVVSFSDITLRKQQEAELQTQLSALESAANAIVITDCRGTIQWVNPAFVRLTGYERKEVLGQNPRVFNAGVHDQAFFESLWQTILAGSVWQGTITNRRKDGVLYQEEMTITPVRSDHCNITHFVAVKQDITERTEQENALKQAKAEAEEATEMKSMFLANMSHEIRTPMNAIIGLSHLALKTELTPKQRDYVGKVHNAGTSLLAIINDILDFSKIEAGKLDIETTDFQLDEVIGSVTTVTAQKAHDKGLEFLADVSSTIPTQLARRPAPSRTNPH